MMLMMILEDERERKQLIEKSFSSENIEILVLTRGNIVVYFMPKHGH